MKYLLGVDEVGRGPLAGPVMVGAVLVPEDFSWSLLPAVADSKKLSAKRRSSIYEAAVALRESGALDFFVAATAASTIDAEGIVPAIRQAIEAALATLRSRGAGDETTWFSQVSVRLDGGLRAPQQYEDQVTIIQGDAKEKVIGLASIVAKVTRDEYMCTLAKETQYAGYDFGTHKGYGTKKHREAIMKLGLSREHRVSFCTNCRP